MFLLLWLCSNFKTWTLAQGKEECKDASGVICLVWKSEGICDLVENEHVARAHCRKTCGFCDCVDRSGSAFCNRWKRLCPKDKKYSKYRCARTCKYCEDGSWGSWSPWSSCSVSCGIIGTETRSRDCNNPAPRGDGLACLSPLDDKRYMVQSETRECKSKTCPVDGAWGKWGIWSACSRKCGVGNQSRTRICNKPHPTHKGLLCMTQHGVRSNFEEEFQKCNSHSCPVHGHWGVWSEWSYCSHTCGRGHQRRFRHCDSPTPEYGGLYCLTTKKTADVEEVDTITCKLTDCPVDGGWGSWTLWSNCDTSCGTGEHQRKRNCDKPRPLYGGRKCLSRKEERDLFETDVEECTGNLCSVGSGYVIYNQVKLHTNNCLSFSWYQIDDDSCNVIYEIKYMSKAANLSTNFMNTSSLSFLKCNASYEDLVAVRPYVGNCNGRYNILTIPRHHHSEKIALGNAKLFHHNDHSIWHVVYVVLAGLIFLLCFFAAVKLCFNAKKKSVYMVHESFGDEEMHPVVPQSATRLLSLADIGETDPFIDYVGYADSGPCGMISEKEQQRISL